MENTDQIEPIWTRKEKEYRLLQQPFFTDAKFVFFFYFQWWGMDSFLSLKVVRLGVHTYNQIWVGNLRGLPPYRDGCSDHYKPPNGSFWILIPFFVSSERCRGANIPLKKSSLVSSKLSSQVLLVGNGTSPLWSFASPFYEKTYCFLVARVEVRGGTAVALS